jgi:hypothetical protein
MQLGDVVREAARRVAQEHAAAQSWKVRSITIGPDVVILATGDCAVAVSVALEGGGEHGFEYRCDATGTGKLQPVERP